MTVGATGDTVGGSSLQCFGFVPCFPSTHLVY